MSKPNIIHWDQEYNRNGDASLRRAVVNVIRGYMDNHRLDGWVSQETLMRDTGLSESQVRRQIRSNIDAGWLTVTSRGRAGRASEYRLSYPQPVMDDRLHEPDESLTGHGRPVSDEDPNRSLMTGYTIQPVIDDRLQPVMDDTPTTPRTSPQEKFSIDPDPFEDQGSDDFRHCSTSPHETRTDDRLEPVTYDRHPNFHAAPHADPTPKPAKRVGQFQPVVIQQPPITWT
ncbi:hypothetical protein MOBUDSM44075_04324 [Mycolicibacterium obuense]|uniref:Helix-turn-helix domain-containing protein n=1 Tax=Mycolicibacterium obuense TaxID=1807 RepID=A0A0J6VF72_9MYCO|nr:hypothetical protein MOBUDSM44075_04324 [Mycolicibacterium obuense]